MITSKVDRLGPRDEKPAIILPTSTTSSTNTDGLILTLTTPPPVISALKALPAAKVVITAGMPKLPVPPIGIGATAELLYTITPAAPAASAAAILISKLQVPR